MKDMEVLILGSGMDSPPFVALLHRTLRALIDRLGVDSFNVGVLNMGPPATLPPLHAVNHQAPSQHSKGGDTAAAALLGAVGKSGMADGEVELGSREGQDVVRAGQGVGLGGSWKPVFARVVSRGHGPASDFGTLEVVGGASIGHTDPYRVMAAIQAQS